MRDLLVPGHADQPAFRATPPLGEGARYDPAVIGPAWPGAETAPGVGADPAPRGLVINELAAKRDPLDWFEVYNASDLAIDLADYLVADDLTEVQKRVAFRSGTIIQPGQHMHFQLDKNAWPGFALGGDEELGIWTAEGDLVDWVDWDQGQAGDGRSFARIPDATGGFQSVTRVTPGRPNHGE